MESYHQDRRERCPDVVIRIPRDPKESCFSVQLFVGLDEVIDLVLCFKVRNHKFPVGDLLAVWQGRPDVVL